MTRNDKDKAYAKEHIYTHKKDRSRDSIKTSTHEYKRDRSRDSIKRTHIYAQKRPLKRFDQKNAKAPDID